MSVVIDKKKCLGCGKCIEICPGNVIRRNDEGKAYMDDPSDCWSCVSCMKECPVQAINMILPPEIEACVGKMAVIQKENLTEWVIEKADGKTIVITTDSHEANKY